MSHDDEEQTEPQAPLTRAERRRRMRMVAKITQYKMTMDRLRIPFPVVIYAPKRVRGKSYGPGETGSAVGRHRRQMLRQRVRPPTDEELAEIGERATALGLIA